MLCEGDHHLSHNLGIVIVLKSPLCFMRSKDEFHSINLKIWRHAMLRRPLGVD